MKFLSGAAGHGDGSAALPLTRRADRILSRRAWNLVVVAVAAAAISLVAARLLLPARSSTHKPTDRLVFAGASQPSPAPSAYPTPVASAGPVRVTSRDEYAIDLYQLAGFPADLGAGTELEIWVSWNEGVVKGPQVQRLVRRATFARFIEPLTPEGPRVAVFSVPADSIGDLMYGDLYGTLSVTVPVSS